MDTSAQWPQGIGINVKQVDNSSQVANNNNKAGAAARPPKDQQALNCPRCNSTNTKFCYYNNYSLSQPRYFCKTCRRYWTNGGSLRNVPVGGGSRKNKRSSSNNPISSNSPNAIISSANKKLNVLPDLNPPSFSSGQDLNLAYNPSSHHHHQLMNGFVHNLNPTNNDPTSSTTSHLPIMEFLKTGGSLSSLMSVNPVSDHSSSMFDQFKPSLGFSLDGINNDNNGYNVNHASRISPFPFEELKPPPVSTTSDQFEHHHQDNREANGYWNGLLTGGGGSW